MFRISIFDRVLNKPDTLCFRRWLGTKQTTCHHLNQCWLLTHTIHISRVLNKTDPHCFRYWLGTKQATCHYLNQCWLLTHTIHISRVLNKTDLRWLKPWYVTILSTYPINDLNRRLPPHTHTHSHWIHYGSCKAFHRESKLPTSGKGTWFRDVTIDCMWIVALHFGRIRWWIIDAASLRLWQSQCHTAESAEVAFYHK